MRRQTADDEFGSQKEGDCRDSFKPDSLPMMPSLPFGMAKYDVKLATQPGKM
jgi:hypothetical protein